MLTVEAIFIAQLIVGRDDARILTTGDIGARRQALERIMGVAPDDRPEEVWQALRQEVERLARCLDVQTPSPAESRTLHCEIRPVAEDEYLPNLITALGQSSDPSVIPTLIRVVPSGGIAATAMIRFGELAVPALIDSALSARSGPWGDESSGAMLTLARMLEQSAVNADQRVGDATRRLITDVARTVLHSKLTWGNQIAVVGLVLATEEPSLRSEVEALATDVSEWQRRGVTDPARIAQAQNSIRFQLSRHPKR